MKKLVLGLMLSFSLLQSSVEGITSFLNQSIHIINTILASPLIPETLSQSEFIVEVERKTKDFSSEVVFYEIKTLSNELNGEVTAGFVTLKEKPKKYLVELNVTENPLIGPPIVTVISITPLAKKSHCD